ncbi:uncharacterized protein BXZ73DRAFT_93459 [Epithele typhae]|uniref:uncharacterized protein n=1 Tax=Epithele typhae TaxID=378194 RepID=UPI0020079BF3|nr:uncharacterized protein BXZ73DRAFT_93459 [Epithele typhae]KAH9911283.1 hypothetical protein BXZ73DRAFT_93459 [Epithele typhae]
MPLPTISGAFLDRAPDFASSLATTLPRASYRGPSQLDDPGVADLGWSNGSITPPQLVGGLQNDEVFMLERRFNKQIRHARAEPHIPPNTLDLESAPNEIITPDKLRATLERMYVTIAVGGAATFKHLARLRSWNEPRRTAGFCVAYFTSWHLSLLPFTLLTTLLVILFSSRACRALFPPAPLAAISATSGNLQVPRAGVVGSGTSLSGAPEAHEGEAVEREAAQFVASLVAVGAGAIAGQRGPLKPASTGTAKQESANLQASDDFISAGVPDATDFALKAKKVRDTADLGGVSTNDPAARVAKQSVETAVWDRMGLAVRTMSAIADTWERFSNAIEPVPPFPNWGPRLRLALALLPFLLVALLLPAEVVVQSVTFIFGALFFGCPVIHRIMFSLTNRYPHWTNIFVLRHMLLRGVPTNAQLTLTLLRLAERANAPLPPPPHTRPASVMAAAEAARPGNTHSQVAADTLKARDFAFDIGGYDPVEGVESSGSEDGTFVDDPEPVEDAVSDTETDLEPGEKDSDRLKRRGSKLIGFLRKTTRTGVHTVLGADRLKAKAGNERARQRLGAVAPRGAAGKLQVAPGDKDAFQREGPTSFSARVGGRKGRVLLVTSAASPCLAFVSEKALARAAEPESVLNQLKHGRRESEGLDAAFTVGVADVVEVRKVGGLGWKERLVVGWATGREVLGGLEVIDRWGTSRLFTAVKGRDELFNRLISMGGQRWECL